MLPSCTLAGSVVQRRAACQAEWTSSEQLERERLNIFSSGLSFSTTSPSPTHTPDLTVQYCSSPYSSLLEIEHDLATVSDFAK